MIISVVIPVYNNERQILRAVNSVLSQTTNKFELVIINDGSTDNTKSILDSLTGSNIKVIHQKNKGVSCARNLGVSVAQSDWVAFLDADDEYRPNFIATMIQNIQSFKSHNLALIGGNYNIKGNPAIGADVKSGLHNYFDLFQNQKSPNHSSSTVVNKLKFIDVGGFPVGMSLMEDWYLYFKLAFSGDFLYIKDVISIYHVTPNSASSNISGRIVEFYDCSLKILALLDLNLKRRDIEQTRSAAIKELKSELAYNYAYIFASNFHRRYTFDMLKRISVRFSGRIKRDKIYRLVIFLFMPKFIYHIIKGKK